jgi:hypothetical protein
MSYEEEESENGVEALEDEKGELEDRNEEVNDGQKEGSGG